MRRDTALKLLSPHGENLIEMMNYVAIHVQGQKEKKKNATPSNLNIFSNFYTSGLWLTPTN